MGYEIDFLAVPTGPGQKSGDAICFRIGNLFGPRAEQLVVVVDGGYTENGHELIKHISKYYKTDVIDLVIATHSDDDHCLGLSPVVEYLDVKQLWIHRPWNHADKIKHMFTNAKLTTKGLSDKFTKSLESARAVEEIAIKKRIPIVEPFVGIGHSNRVYVAAPTTEYYQELLTQFDCAPPTKDLVTLMMERYLKQGVEAVKKKFEDWNIETLSENAETSPENNASVVLYIVAEDETWLLTADAGVQALSKALDTLEANSITSTTAKFIQVPHHGSHHSMTPSLATRLLGQKLAVETPLKTAFVSAAKDAPKHPSRKVTNAFRRRGAPVHATQGTSKWHHRDAPARGDYSNSIALPLFSEVEEEG